MSYHHIEVASIVVCLIAAVVYLVVETVRLQDLVEQAQAPT